jgi:putative salt-induced outer membrane protein YdiY
MRLMIPIICLLIPISSVADEVFMKNGDRLSGKIVSKIGDKLVLETAYTGKIEIQWDAISHLTTDNPVRITLDDETELKGMLLVSDDTDVRVITDVDAGPKFIPLHRIAAINPPQLPSFKISGQANLGISLERGNTDEDNYHLDAESIFRWPNDRIMVAFDGDLEKNNSKITEQEAELLVDYDHFLNKNLYLTIGPLFEHDKFADLDLRTTVMAGAGYQVFENDRTNLAIKGGPGYAWEKFDDSEDDDYPVAVWRLRFDHYLFEAWKLQAFHNHRLSKSLDEPSDYTFDSKTGLRIPIYGPLQATLQFNFDRDNAPGDDVKKNDYEYLLTVGYRW